MRSSRLNSLAAELFSLLTEVQAVIRWSQLCPRMVLSEAKHCVAFPSLHHLEDEKDGVRYSTSILTDTMGQMCPHTLGQPSWAKESYCSLSFPHWRGKEAALELQPFSCQNQNHRSHGSVKHHRIYPYLLPSISANVVTQKDTLLEATSDHCFL